MVRASRAEATSGRLSAAAARSVGLLYAVLGLGGQEHPEATAALVLLLALGHACLRVTQVRRRAGPAHAGLSAAQTAGPSSPHL